MSQMTAKYPGTCRACGGSFQAGTLIEWSKAGGARHAKCPPAGAILNAAFQPEGRTGATNKRAASCSFCGDPIAAGQGNRWWGEDGCCSNPQHFDEGGWHITCQDREACQARIRAAREIAKAAKAERAAKAAEAAAAAKIEATRLLAERDQILAGLERTTAAAPEGTVVGAVIHRDNTGWYKITLTEAHTADGQRVVVEEATGHDDWRRAVWANPQLARELRLAAARKNGITPEKAREWMSKYGGCEGADIYAAVIE